MPDVAPTDLSAKPITRKPKPFKTIAITFAANLQAIRIFNERTSRPAERHDSTAVETFITELSSVLGFDFRSGQAGVSPEEAVDESPRLPAPEGDPANVPDRRKEDLETAVLKTFRDPAKVSLFRGAVDRFRREAPSQGELLRRGAVVILVSYFESLLAELIQGYYLRYPEAMPADERLLSLAELRELGSVEEAERHLIEKESDNVLRGSLKEQLSYFAKRLKIDLGPLEPYEDGLNELVQRRNLLVHANGVVNRVYLRLVPPEFRLPREVKEGDQLSVTEDYLADRIDAVDLAGSVILQLCWRKWEKTDAKAADSDLCDRTLESLVESRYRLARDLAIVGSAVNVESARSKLVIAINHAIALKRLGDRENMDALLKRFDWSAAGPEFQVALHALRDEEYRFFPALRRAVAAKVISLSNLRDWPLFADLRETSSFKEEVERLFPSETSDPSADQADPPTRGSGS